MNLNAIIARIRSECPGFAYVDHGLTSALDHEMPAALVVPMKRKGGRPLTWQPYIQQMSLQVGVFVIVRRRQNGEGDNGAADDIEALCESLRDALINWSDQPAIFTQMESLGGEIAPFVNGVSVWREDFATEYHIRKN